MSQVPDYGLIGEGGFMDAAAKSAPLEAQVRRALRYAPNFEGKRVVEAYIEELEACMSDASNIVSVDFTSLDDWFEKIPPGPYLTLLKETGAYEVRAIDTDPQNKHHWPYRLLESIAGQRSSCDEAVFNFVAGVINAWPEIKARIEELEKRLASKDELDAAEKRDDAERRRFKLGNPGRRLDEPTDEEVDAYLARDEQPTTVDALALYDKESWDMDQRLGDG